MFRERAINFNNSLVIIDEVHNLINGVKNKSRVFSLLYNEISKAKCRILALSGTPIFNYVYEWPLLGNLLKPGTFPTIIRENEKEIDSEAFMEKFHEKEDGTIIPVNPTRMKRDLEGIVSFFPGSVEFFPELINMPPIKVVMPEPQELNYWEKFEQEQKLSHPPSEKLRVTNFKLYEDLKKLYIMTKKNILTRGAGNFYYPPEYLKIKDDLVKNGGWVNQEAFINKKLLKLYSPKFSAFFINVMLHPHQKHVLFSFFKTKHGVNLIQAMFEMSGVPTLIFSGDMNDSRRKNILKSFNSTSNRRGEKYKVLLATESAMEGITLLDVRHVHILESSPRETKIQQAIGRAVRYNSHSNLPTEERNVKVWRYWSIGSAYPIVLNIKIYNPNGELEEIMKEVTDKETMDEKLYKKGQQNLERIKSFQKLLQEVSVT